MEFNSEQLAAAEHRDGHALVLAGAGTGKTRTIIGRAAYLMKQGVNPKRILMLTFTRRASREMLDRLRKWSGSDVSGIMAGTFHHFCLYIMRRMPKEFKLPDTAVIDRDDQQQLMKLVRANYREKGEVFPQAGQLINYCSYARNTNQPAKSYLEKFTELEPEVIGKVLKVFRDYEARKRDNGYLDYDDILFIFAKQLHEGKAIGDRVRGMYDHILVDEMQDTNPLQWLILDGLRDPAKLFCVGDDAQSIYAFRGADFRNVHSFGRRIPNSTVLKLEENYRSTQEILDLANWLLNSSSLPYDKHLRAHRGKGLMPGLLDFENEFDEAEWIANDLIERHENGTKWEDHMIITRTAYACRTLEATLVEKKVPYVFVGGTSLLQAAHVKDLFALIRAAASHQDELAWVRFLTLWPKIGDTTALRLIQNIRSGYDVKAALAVLKQLLEKRPEIPAAVETMLKLWNRPDAAIKQAEKILKPLLKEKYPDNWNRRARDFKLLQKLASRHRSMLAFIEAYTLDPVSSTQAEREETDDAVILITAHSAKGTEAPVCYVIRVEPGMYPHIRSLGDKSQEEEERRVLYVAMTRAENELVLTRCNVENRRGVMYGGHWGKHSPGGTDYFLRDMPPSLVDTDIANYSPDPFSDYDIIRPMQR